MPRVPDGTPASTKSNVSHQTHRTITDAAMTTTHTVALQTTPVRACDRAGHDLAEHDQRELSAAFFEVLLDGSRVSESSPPEQGVVSSITAPMTHSTTRALEVTKIDAAQHAAPSAKPER